MLQNQKYQSLRKRSNILPIISFGLLLFLVLGLFCPVDSKLANAAAQPVHGDELVESEVTLTLGKEGTNVELAPTADTVATGHIALRSKVSVKNSGGYTVTLQANKSALTSGTNTIPSMSGTATINQIPENTWGYAAAENLTGAQYRGVADTNGNPSTITILTNKATGNNISEEQEFYLSFATRINGEQPAGNYTNSVTLSVVSQPGVVATFGGITTMQELTADVCKSAKENDTAYLKDTRDGNHYWVTKLADGNCWMSQNLALNLTKDVPVEGSIVNADGTVSAYTYMPEATTMTPSNNDRFSSTYGNSNNAIYSWNEGKWVLIKPGGGHTVSSGGATAAQGGLSGWANSSTLDSLGVETEAQRATTSRVTYTMDGKTYDGVVADVSDSGWTVAEDPNFTASSSYTQNGNGYNKTAGWAIDPVNKVYDAHYLVGNYYQWFAATAQMTADGVNVTADGTSVSSSICPKNWQLPLSGTINNTTNGSFYNLLDRYNLTSVTKPDGTNATDNIAEGPLFYSRSGTIYPSYGFISNVGRSGRYWSSTSYSSTYAYGLVLNQSGVYISDTGGRRNGYFVRCLVLVPEE